uniref:RanBP2-type domain-containing protein n=1 Tax=Globisporangium ultimum (strain ATCC 200006 / CBS 805.95 / DAOM BR144) TaxID=431595 RepID=K3WDG2_GLOUD
MASDSIQKLLAADASASAATPQKEENESNGAKKKLEMDAISTPEAVGVRGRRSMSSAKRRKTISAIPHTPNPKTVPSVETSNTQKALFHDDAASECVADSQSEVDEAQSKQPSSATLQFSDDSIVPSSVTSSVSTNVVSDTVEAAAVRASSGSPNGTDNAALGAMTETVTNGNAGPTTKVADVPFDKSKPEATTNATDSAQVDIVDLTVLSSATSSGTSQIGKPDKVLKATSTPATSTPATSTPATTVVATKSVGAPAKAKAPAAPAIWACTKCGCTNARTRRLCKDCRTPKTAFDALRAETPEVAKKPAAPIPKVPSAATRASRTTTPAVPVAPKTPVVTAATTRRILTTPKTLTRPALSASRRQLTTPVTLSKSAARKLPLGAPKSPPRPLSALSDRHTQGSSQMSISSGSSVSVLEMTPVRVPERPGSKRSLYTSGSESGAKRQRLSEMKSSPSQRVIDLSNEQKVNLDRSLDRLATPRQSTSSRRSRSIGTSTPVKTPVKTPAAVKSARPTRSVIGITGVDMETRGVIECAVHAIDATMVTESGYRKARVVKSVDYAAAVTHLIVGEDTKRTIKVLFAIARGAWIVSEAWVFSSLEKEQWLPEEDFELDMFSNKYARMHPEERQIFKSMKFFVGSNVEPSREVLQSLLQSAGGEICNQISVADMVICGDGSLFRRAQRTGIRVVTAKWVFDSIGAMKLEDDVKYGLSTTSTSLEDD